MTRVRFYVATSLDGFIADREGSVDWLAPYEPHNYGYDRFLGEIGAIVMGRRTYELIRAVGEEWPYAGKPVIVLSSSSLGEAPPGVIPNTRGIRAALQQAREATRKDIWVIGGAVTMQSALEERLIDTVELFVVPVLLGAGLNLLNDLSQRPALLFDGIEAFPDGVVKLRYQLER
jgi:dihydrofolate reductase